MTNHLDYYASRAVQSEQFAERAISPSLADSYANKSVMGGWTALTMSERAEG